MYKHITAHSISDFPNYKISYSGTIYNSKGKEIKTYIFSNKTFVRLYKKGERHTLQLTDILEKTFGYEDDISYQLHDDERIFRYKNTPYFITSNCRVYNKKTKKWLMPIYRGSSPSIKITENGKRKTISILKFLKEQGGISKNEHYTI